MSTAHEYGRMTAWLSVTLGRLLVVTCLLGVCGCTGPPFAETSVTSSALPGRTSGTAPGVPGDQAPVAPDPTPRSPAVTRAKLAGLRLMNYYPADAPWTSMWTNWQPAVIDRDFARIAALGANAVRIIVHPSALGYPRVDQDRLNELNTALDLAADHHLAVQLTLFDWFDGYGDTLGSDQWSSALLRPLRNDPRLAFVEVKNEVDPGDASAMSWLRHELPVVRSLVGDVPVTVSVAGTSPLQHLQQLKNALGSTQPDFYDIHYYGTAGAARAVLGAARVVADPSPLFVGETGASSDGVAGEIRQDHYLRSVEWACQSLGLPLAAPWTLTDINRAAVPPGGHGEDRTDLNDGIYRTDGGAKTAATTIDHLFHGRPVSTAFNNDLALAEAGQPAGWTFSGVAGGRAGWDVGGHRSPGSASLQQTGGTLTAPSALTAVPVAQPIVPGDKFRLTAWARGQHATGSNTVAINWIDVHDRPLVTSTSVPLADGTTDWQLLSIDSVAPAGAAYALIGLNSSANSGVVRYDDVAFDKLTTVYDVTS